MSETALAFILVFALGLSLALFVRPIYGLYTYMGVFYLHPPSRWWGASLPELRWSLIAGLVTLIAIFLHRERTNPLKPFLQNNIAVLLACFTAWMWIQYPWVVSPHHLAGVILFTKYLILMYVMNAIINNEKDLQGFCVAHVIGCAYFGVLVYLAPDTGRLEGVGGPGVDDANTLGMHLGTGLMFASFLILGSKGWIRWLMICSVPFILNGIIQTETRGALVGLVLGGVATIYLKPKRLRRTYYALAALGVLTIIWLANDAFLERMQSLNAAVDQEQVWDNSAESRLVIASAQIEMFKDYPLGVGHQGTATLSRSYMEEKWLATNSGDRASHNTVLSILVDQGIPGIIIFTLLAVAVVRSLRALKKMDSRGLPDSLAIYRAMIGGAILVVLGSGMFAQHLKAEIQIWCLSLLIVLWNLAHVERDSNESASADDESSGPEQKRIARANSF